MKLTRTRAAWLAISLVVSGVVGSVVAHASSLTVTTHLTTATKATTLTTIPGLSVTVTFPVSGTSYATGNNGSSSWTTKSTAACGAAKMCGTASGGSGGITKIEISFEELGTTNKCWDGTSFAATCDNWVTIGGTTSWSFSWAQSAFPAKDNYSVKFRVTDGASNTGTSSTIAFDTKGT